MPIYEYACENCGKTHEVFLQRTMNALPCTCPDCRGALKKLISNTSFVLKGTGWYKTDYAQKDSQKKENKS